MAKVPRLAITNVELTPLALCEMCISSSLNTEYCEEFSIGVS